MKLPIDTSEDASSAPSQLAEGSSFKWLRRGIVFVGGVMLLVMMAMTIVDVIGRYVFNSPLSGAGELTEILLVSVIFMGLPAVTLEKGHVTVDLFTARMPPWIERWRIQVIGLLSTVILSLIGWQLWVHAGQIGAYGDVTTTLRIPISPVAYFCSVCTFISAIAALIVSFEPLFQRSSKG
ncbi:TRAP transporter small permease subunit [Hoeflea sp. AS60]|uniref:TRAP transporter small permease n=1 Tax=Hoeflea sp. AS60 TaxID=3135780 RepID=UPI0031721841